MEHDGTADRVSVPHRLLFVAGKEFADHLSSRRFILVLLLFLILCSVSLFEGIEVYSARLAAYSGATGGWVSPVKPSILDVFRSLSSQIRNYGPLLAIAIGFDLVTRERWSGSLKTLLTRPVFRDEIITGKAIGGFAALALAMSIAVLIALALLLLSAIVPSPDELGAILVFWLVSLVYLFTFFSAALLASSVVAESGSALVWSLVAIFVFSSVVPMAGGILTDATAGTPPAAVNTSDPHFTEEVWLQYREELRSFEEHRNRIAMTVNLLSPQRNYQELSIAITSPWISMWVIPDPFALRTEVPLPDLPGLIALVWQPIVTMLAFPAVFFGAAYARFLRIDLR
ncbi:ABC transporter permease [Methanoculleus thermophilus]|uniref:ABC-2 type transport system permease protein n=1 Tax=Methanoculleus thermophilus TaxID=2200 RepID=A0A1G8X5I0_9EURY|nr:ABC transporter permease [Methanoculleus thermophilus]SDJ85075.1 ABC-2 type transport system permease protein [Methanoculleus thermophilus]